MTSYGGYSRTSYGAQGDGDGGGFLGGSQQGSQGGGGGGKSYGDESLRPVTIKQLVDCEEPYPGADLVIDGMAITQVTCVGQVRGVNPQATNITYRLDDGTAVLDVKKWVDAEKADDADPQFAPDQYVRVWGRLKSFNGKKHLGAHFIRAVDDYNEVSYHMLEATYVHLCFTEGGPPPANGDGNAAGGGGGGGDSMFVDGYEGGGGAGGGGGNSRVSTCSKNAQKVYNFMNNSAASNEGINVHQIAAQTRMPIRDVQAATEELVSNGIIFSTLDEETFAILEY